MFHRNHFGWGVELGDVAEQDEGGHLAVDAVGAGDDQGVIAEVAVVGLVVIDSPGIFGPQLDLIDFQVLSAEQALGGVGEVGIDRDLVQRPEAEWEDGDTGELAAGILRIGVGVGEVILWLGVQLEERLAGIGQGLGVEESLDHGEATVPDLGELLITDFHGSSVPFGVVGRTFFEEGADALGEVVVLGTEDLVAVFHGDDGF